MAVHESLFASALNLIEERGDQVVFGSESKASWGESEFGTARPITSSELVIDRRYWEMLGKPDKMPVAFANEAGWIKWMGAVLPAQVKGWLEATDKEV